MNNREDNNFIDVESSPVLDGEQVAWRSCFDEKEPKKKKKEEVLEYLEPLQEAF